MNFKKIIESQKIRQWEIAEIIGVSEFTLSRWLRRPENLKEEQQKMILTAINELSEKGA